MDALLAELGGFTGWELVALVVSALVIVALGRYFFRGLNSHFVPGTSSKQVNSSRPSYLKPKVSDASHTSADPSPADEPANGSADEPIKPIIKIFYASQTGTAETLAKELAKLAANDEALKAAGIGTEVVSLATYNVEDLKWERAAIFVVSTYEGGKFPAKARQFGDGVEDLAFDFRVSKTHLKDLRFALFGLGHKDYAKNFNKAAKVCHINPPIKALQSIPSMNGR